MSTRNTISKKKNNPSSAFPSDLKASDFFPAGNGWNQSEKPTREFAWQELDDARSESQKSASKH